MDVFIAVGELALFVGLADRWPPRSRIAAWAVTGVGLVVSVAGNVGHVSGHVFTNRATASIPPLAAASALAVGLGVLKRVVAAYPVPRGVPSGTPEGASGVPAGAPEPEVPVPGEAPADEVPVPVDGYPVPPRGREAATAFASELRAGRVPGLRPIRTRLRVGQARAQEIRDYLAVLAARTPVAGTAGSRSS